MSVGLGVPSASALFFNMCMFSPRMQRDHCILLTIRIDIKRPLENETLHLVSYPLKKKGRREDIFFIFFSFITDNDNFKWKQKIRPIELGFTESFGEEESQ